MFLKEREIAYAKKSIDNFRSMSGLENTSDVCDLVIEFFLHEGTRRATASGFFAFASPSLSRREREGIVLYTALILHSDDILDSEHFSGDPQKLVEYLLKAPVGRSNRKLSGDMLYNSMMDCFPRNKREIIDDYLIEMARIHSTNAHLGEPGCYGFKEAREYKYKTNVPSFVTGLYLAESELPPEDFATLFIAGQYLDDIADWQKDKRNLNMFIGMANDIWREKGCPDWQDFDYLMETDSLPFPEKRIKEFPMRDTQVAYKKAFFGEFAEKGRVPMAFALKTSGLLMFC